MSKEGNQLSRPQIAQPGQETEPDPGLEMERQGDGSFMSGAQTVSKDVTRQIGEYNQNSEMSEILKLDEVPRQRINTAHVAKQDPQNKDGDYAGSDKDPGAGTKEGYADFHPVAQDRPLRQTMHSLAPSMQEATVDHQKHSNYNSSDIMSMQPQSFKRDRNRKSSFKEGAIQDVAEKEHQAAVALQESQPERKASMDVRESHLLARDSGQLLHHRESSQMLAQDGSNRKLLSPTKKSDQGQGMTFDPDPFQRIEKNSNQNLSEQLDQLGDQGQRLNSAGNAGGSAGHAGSHEEENQLIGGPTHLVRHTALANDLKQNKYTTLRTITNYVASDIKKKQRSFKIGVFTIFLVVTFVVMLRSVVDKVGVAFLKVAQDQGGIFDVTLATEYGGGSIDGDIAMYTSDPFEYPEPPKPNQTSFFESFDRSLVKDNGDHAEVAGFKLLNFAKLREQLDPLSNITSFKGFTPRWILPTRFRNSTNSARNTSCILIVLDSRREIDYKIGEYFSQEVLGENEIMITDQALIHLDVDKDRKEQIEMYFDIGAMLQMFQSFSGGGFSTPSVDGPNITALDEQINEEVNDEVGSQLSALLPSVDQVAGLLKENGFNVSDDNNLVVDINQVVRDNLNLSSFDITIPSPINLTEILPIGTNLSFLDDLDFNVPDDSLLSSFTPKELLTGDVTVNLDVLSAVLEGIGGTEINIPLEAAMAGIFSQYFNFSQIDISLALQHNYTVVDAFSSAAGKFGNTLGNVALVDCRTFQNLFVSSYDRLKDELSKVSPLMVLVIANVDTQIKSMINQMNFCDYAMTVNGMIDNQIDVYTDGKSEMNFQIGNVSNQIIDAVGQDSNITMTFPLKEQMKNVEFITIFVSSNMMAIVAFLAILCTQLIYSLMLSDVEEKTYEFGMLRALGFNTKNVGVTIVMQAVSFALPGLILGFISAAVLNIIVRYVLYSITTNYDTYELSYGSVWIGVILGTFIPLMSNIIPIQKALGKNLRSSLDLYHRKAGELTIAIQKLKDYGLSMEQFVLAIMLVVLGVMTYYVAPVSFLFQKIELFFLILNGLLLIMILGLTFLSMLLQPYFQKALLSLSMCLCRRDRNLHSLISKNMESHAKRNIKTAMMFGICLSFLIFAGGSFKLVGELIVSQLEISVGSDLYGIVVNPRTLPSFIDQGQITQFLLEQQQLDGAVLNWTYASPSLKQVLNKISVDAKKAGTYFSDATGYKTVRANFYAIQDNYLDATNQKYYIMTELTEDYKAAKEAAGEPELYVKDGQVNVVDALYTNYNATNAYNTSDPFNLTNRALNKNQTFNQINIIIPEGYRDVCSMDTKKVARMCVGHDCQATYQTKVVAMLKKMPGWYFTAYQSAQFFAQQLISEKQYKQLLVDYMNMNPETWDKYNDLMSQYNFTEGVPKYKLFVKLNDSISDERRDFIANGIRSYFKDDQTVLLDLKFAMKSVVSSLSFFQIFVGVVGSIALSLAFFLLMVSTTQNIKENIWEYGCLRAVGLSKNQGTRVFLYEQYIVIICSLVLGTLVGFILAAVCTAQFFLFLEFPFRLEFPAELLYAMIGLALVTTFFAVYLPVTKVNKQQVSTTIKGISTS